MCTPQPELDNTPDTGRQQANPSGGNITVSNAIRWADIDPAKIEDIISVLISRLHPETQRIDGSGGDGGRDVQIPLSSGLIIYEVKSFTDRLTNSRKSQIKRSLRKAAMHNPKQWHLVMPLDVTPSELEWYNKLKNDYPFVSNFTRGKTWLDSELSQRPEIARYYIGDSNAEIVSYLREIREEEAGLSNGVRDAHSRVKRILTRLNEIDPHYIFGIHVTPNGTIKTEVLPRYPGAEIDRPIVIKTTFAFPKTPEGEAAAAEFRDSLDFGLPVELSGEFVKQVEVDAPAGMGGSWVGGGISLEAVPAPEPDGLRYSAVVTDARSHQLATIPLTLTRRFRGEKGAQIELSDLTGFFKIQSRLNVREKTAAHTFSFEHCDGVLPTALLPTLRFMSHLKAGNQWGLAVNNEITQLHMLSDAFMPDLPEYGRYVSILAKVQEYAGFTFPIPEIMSDEDAEQLRLANYLISGKDLVGKFTRGTLTFTGEGVERWRTTSGTDAGQLRVREDFYIELCGNRMHLGEVQRIFSPIKARELPETDGSTPGETFPVELIPEGDATVITTLLPREEPEF
jgi:hypothetical protein